MKEYKIFDIRGGLMADDTTIKADSPIQAVRKLYNNVKRNYRNTGNIVVNGKYVYDGEKK